MIKRKFRIAFVGMTDREKALCWKGSNYYSYWKAEDTDTIAEKASKKLQGFIKGVKYNFAAIMVQREIRGFKVWQEVGVVDENGWRSDIIFNSNNI